MDPPNLTAALPDEARAALAHRLLELAPMIRRRVRDRLSPSERRIFDSQDLLSTLLRRVDRLAMADRIRAQSDGELISLVLTILDNALLDRHRVFQKLNRVDGPDGQWAQRMLAKLELNADDAGQTHYICAAFDVLDRDEDRLYLAMWLRDAPHTLIASMLGISHDTARQRWKSIRDRLAATFVPTNEPA
ncbi:MAG: hypothetical protein AAGH71_03130 [Planctomycetota bacterium]